MKKIPTLFKRDFDGDPSRVLPEINPEAQWVIDGEGIATVKLDGTGCLVRDGKLFKRYDQKKGRTAPVGWEPCQPEPDPNTGHWPGWLAVGDRPDDKYHLEAWARGTYDDGTYELVGPKINGNPEHMPAHFLVPHGVHALPVAPRDYETLKAYLADKDIEGIVWHHPDGRMAKIKRRDFGLPWPARKEES